MLQVCLVGPARMGSNNFLFLKRMLKSQAQRQEELL